jgi:hypothetical protein
MQPSTGPQDFDARSQPEVICIPKNYLRVEFAFQRLKADAFDGACRANRHEGRRFNHAAPGREYARTRFVFTGRDFKSYCRLVRHGKRKIKPPRHQGRQERQEIKETKNRPISRDPS